MQITMIWYPSLDPSTKNGITWSEQPSYDIKIYKVNHSHVDINWWLHLSEQPNVFELWPDYMIYVLKV